MNAEERRGDGPRSIDTREAHIITCGFAQDEVARMGPDEPALVIFSDGATRQTVLGEAVALLCGGARASDHLGPSGRYFVDYLYGDEMRTSESFATDGDATRLQRELARHGISVVAVYEEDASGRTFVLWSADDEEAHRAAEDGPAATCRSRFRREHATGRIREDAMDHFAERARRYFNVEGTDDQGRVVFTAADIDAKQLLFGWAAGDRLNVAYYGNSADDLPLVRGEMQWRWRLMPDEASRLADTLRAHRAQPKYHTKKEQPRIDDLLGILDEVAGDYGGRPSEFGASERGEEAEAHAVDELILYIDNDGDLYRSQTTAIMRNLAQKMIKSRYDEDRAPQAWRYLADAGAQKYTREFGEGGRHGSYGTFSPADRQAVAVKFARRFERQVKNGEFDLKELAAK